MLISLACHKDNLAVDYGGGRFGNLLCSGHKLTSAGVDFVTAKEKVWIRRTEWDAGERGNNMILILEYWE